MYLYGASGHAKVIIDILQANGVEVKALFDDNPDLKELEGTQVLPPSSTQNNDLVISIGNNRIRKKIAESIRANFQTAIHPKSTIAPTVKIGNGTVVMAGVVMNPSVVIGEHCIVNTSSSIDHDCTIGDYVHVSPGVTLCGGVRIGEGTQVGAGASVIPMVKIGKWCTIGAGAIIIRDVPDYAVVVGNPGKIVRYDYE